MWSVLRVKGQTVETALKSMGWARFQLLSDSKVPAAVFAVHLVQSSRKGDTRES